MNKQLKANYAGKLKLGNAEVQCFVTEDGTRMISGRGVTSAIGMRGRGQGMARISNNKILKPFINNELMLAIDEPIILTGMGLNTSGYEATILADICEVIQAARDAGKLKTAQEIRYAQYADAFFRSLAKVGLIALIDEATGYQEYREKDALQQILDKFLQDERHKWSKTFPDSFWHKLIKVKGYPSYMALKRPAFVGHWVNDIVYDRLAPGITKRLKQLNPRTDKGHRKNKHTQHLTEDYGLPELKDHLSKTMVLMDASANDSEFKRLLNRSMPKYGDTIDLPLEEK